MFEIYRQSLYFLYRNYWYFVPVLLAFAVAISLIVKTDELIDISPQSMEELWQIYRATNAQYVPLIYLLGLPLMGIIARRRLYSQGESLVACQISAIAESIRVIVSLTAILAALIILMLLFIQLSALVLPPAMASAFAFFVYGILLYVLIRMSLCMAVLVEEKTSPFAALKTSFTISRGRMLKILAAYAIMIGAGVIKVMLVRGTEIIAGTETGIFISNLADAHLNLLLIVVFYRFYLLCKTTEAETKPDIDSH